MPGIEDVEPLWWPPWQYSTAPFSHTSIATADPAVRRARRISISDSDTNEPESEHASPRVTPGTSLQPITVSSDSEGPESPPGDGSKNVLPPPPFVPRSM